MHEIKAVMTTDVVTVKKQTPIYEAIEVLLRTFCEAGEDGIHPIGQELWMQCEGQLQRPVRLDRDAMDGEGWL